MVIATPRALYTLVRPGTHSIRDGVNPRVRLEIAEIFASTWIRSPDRPALFESLYRLSYSDPHKLTFLLRFHSSYTLNFLDPFRAFIYLSAQSIKKTLKFVFTL